MVQKLATVTFAALAMVAVVHLPAAAQDKCAGSKLTATGKKCSAKLNCIAKAAGKGVAVDGTCLGKAETKFASSFTKAEGKGGCNTLGDAAAIEAKVDAHVADVRAELWTDEPADNDCASSKVRAAGKKCLCKTKCSAKAAKSGAGVDPLCMQKCEQRFATAFTKAESKGGCTTTGDAPAIEAKVDAFVSDVEDDLQPTSTTTSTTTTTTLPAACGDGAVNGLEECDDGGVTPGDGCSATCELESVNPAVCAGIPTVAGTNLDTVRIASGLVAPVHVAAPRLDPRRVFIVEQPGRIRLVKDGVLLGPAFLDIGGSGGRVTFGGEQGLLSVAFDPDYETNRFFYVYYVDLSGDLVISRFEATAGNEDDADEGSEHIIVTVPHPTFGNHNGGNLNFGLDGFLYAATGDGGSGGDPSDNAQNDSSRLGKLLRIDVDTDAVTTWAKGLRNPFRFSFDRGTGDLYIGDVGQGAWEEIDYDPAPITAGVNYGWDDMEGRHCFEPSVGCLTAGRTLPVLEYCSPGHSDSGCNTFQTDRGRAVIGGFVYRGCAQPDLHGTYFYSDNLGNDGPGTPSWIKTFEGVSGGDAQNVQDRTADLDPPGALAISAVTSFGEDARGELHIADAADGEVYRIIPAP
jgi:cysteine-rich repeat protein